MLDKRTSGNGILWLFLADQFFNSIVQVLVLLLMWLHFKVASYLLVMLKMLFTIDYYYQSRCRTAKYKNAQIVSVLLLNVGINT